LLRQHPPAQQLLLTPNVVREQVAMSVPRAGVTAQARSLIGLEATIPTGPVHEIPRGKDTRRDRITEVNDATNFGSWIR